MPKFGALTLLGTTALTLFIAAPAMAQDTTTTTSAATDNGTTPEIVVTAQFREQRLQDTPLAITAVNAAMLEARGQTDITQVAAQAPNVTLRPQPQNGGSGLIAFIRGVGQTDFNYALDPGVGVYVDDVYIPTLSSSLLELIDLDRIEILRGPQGTLAGKNSIGGAIKLFSAKPKGDGSGSISVGYGSYNALNVRGMADFAITSNLAARVSGMSRSSDGYVGMLDYGQTHPNSNVPVNNARGGNNADYSTMGGQNISAVRGALRWTPASSVEVNVSADYTRENSDAIPAVLIAAGAIDPTGASFNPKSIGPALSLNGSGAPIYTNPWLVGKNGQAVPMSCAFVPAGPYSCDTGGNLQGWDPRFVSYSNFIDAMKPNPQAPYKPYFALPITKFNGWGVHGNLSYDISPNFNLFYVGSYRAYTSKFGQDQDATPLAVAQLDNQLDHHAYSSELRLNFKDGNGLLEGTVGGFYLKQKGTYTARVDLNYVFATIDFIHGPDTTPSTTKALFGTATLHPTDAMSITGGIRYTKDKKDYTYQRHNPDGSAVCGPGGLFGSPNCLLAGGFSGTTGTFEGDRWDYRGVIDYRFSPQFLAYASISTGFKGGGVNPRPFVGDQALPFRPETLTTYEVGFKSDFWDRRIRLNGAAFFNKYKDIVLAKLVCPESSAPAPCLRPDNISSADVKGFELETTIRPAAGLTFDGSFSYLDFKYTGGCTAGLLTGSAIPCNAITPYTPKTNWSVGAQYDYDVGPGQVSFRVDGSYQSKMYTASENTVWSKIDSRFLANGQVSFTSADKAWKLTGEVRNIFDKYYFLSVSDVTSSLGIVSGVPGLPRTWSVTLKRTF